ncbi:MAG: CPBP family intramembrane glutamic endopeptidase [Gaiellaceae bacterium]
MRPAIGAGRIAAWATLVVVVGGLNAVGHATEGAPAHNVLYKYSTAAGGAVQYAVILGIVLVIARGLDLREVFALRRPRSVRAAAGWIGIALVSVWMVSFALSQVLDAGKDQGLVPDRWEPRHAGAFAANFAVVVIVAPLVEELTFRGFGVSGLAIVVGPMGAIAGVGLAFGVWHGLLIAFPVLAILGAILAALRTRTASVYPSMVAHAIFNGVALVAAVTVGGGG